ncbi:hypothetical protein EDD37DRAFT_692378 [Exophiala viscosa]|uniref:Uncharacterized protein n=1 Tax=Exophiala viscosa TaxID=2486360 RepID=A0AAN6E942_9EURO|nr:hypothetical protein EDD36DRAFT_414636 [Exophiala viscosa]KAI1628112.1 hypothetical protein EDD37DRAFT_692378 [Exophiala viscosa]
MAEQQDHSIYDESCECEPVSKEPCVHGFHPISVTLAQTGAYDFSLLRPFFNEEIERINKMIINVQRYGELQKPESEPQEETFLTVVYPFIGRPTPDPERLRKEYNEVAKSFWKDFMSGDSEMGRTYNAYRKEYLRKHGPRGVFVELKTLYPESVGEIMRDRRRYTDIFSLCWSLRSGMYMFKDAVKQRVGPRPVGSREVEDNEI